MNLQVDYIGQASTLPEMRLDCKHVYRKCPHGCVWCKGKCGFLQIGRMSIEGEPEIEELCEYHRSKPQSKT